MRGEQLCAARSIAAEMGSPPHARGTAGWDRLDFFRERITPACAGNSTSKNSGQDGEKDHPRMRGEQTLTVNPDAYIRGSPPHARGTDFRDVSFAFQLRITPACAGNR